MSTDATVLRPIGRLNRTMAKGLAQELQILIRTGRTRLVVDLSAVESIDAACLGALLSCRKAARECGGDLLIAHPNDQVISMLTVTNLGSVLRRCDQTESLADAP